MAITIGNHSENLELKFSATTAVRISTTPHTSQLIIFAQAKSIRASLKKLEDSLKEYSPLMNAITERVVERALKIAAPFVVGSPILDQPKAHRL